MDHIHKALIGSSFGQVSPLKRKANSCRVCRLRFNTEVGVVVWEGHTLNCSCFVFSVGRFYFSLTHTNTHPGRRADSAEETCPFLSSCFTGSEDLRSLPLSWTHPTFTEYKQTGLIDCNYMYLPERSPCPRLRCGFHK